MLLISLGIISSYLLGSIPTAYLYGRIFKGIDIRSKGSGNVGAANALRVFGKKAGIVVLLIDIIKGLICVILIGDYFTSRTVIVEANLLRFILGIACISGHNWTVFLRFRGGKGVATTFGVLIGLSFKVYGLAIVLSLVITTWLVMIFATRIVSLASVSSAIIFPLLMVMFKYSQGLIVLSFLVSAFLIFRHLPNVKRFLQGKEPRLSFKKHR
ncbi:MAG: glycerol-3-phosphate 1-O-acyltransferase PlsY [Candidatus Omnitrophota bacterium]